MSNSEKRFLSGLLDRIFSQKKTERLFESKEKGRKSLEERRLSMEPLEERQLLAVTPADYAGIQTTFDSLELNDYSSVNVIEIENTSLTSSSLKDAISQAAASQQDDIIILRTTKDNYSIDLQGEAIQINIDSSAQGSISIIGYGESMLHLVNDDLNLINVESGKVNLGGINLATAIDSTQLKNVLLTKGDNVDVATQRVLFSSNYSVDTTEITDASLVLPNSAGTADSSESGNNDYYSAEFQLSGSKWVYVTGLSQYEAQDIENNVYAGTNEFYVGQFFDAEKDDINDSQLCWAATASNILAYTSWGYTVGENEDDIFDYFKENFTDGGSRIEFGLEWFMNGNYEAQGGVYELLGWSQYTGTGGALYSDYDFSDYGGSITSDLYYSTYSQSPLYAVEQYIRDGYGMGIALGWYQETTEEDDDTTTPESASYGELTRGGGHAISMWGFVYDDTKTIGATDYYVSLIVSDSDDDYGLGRTAPNRLQTYDVTWRETEMQYEFVSYGRSDTFFGIIEDFDYFGQAPPEAKSDDPYEVNNSIEEVNAFTEAAENSPNLGLIVGDYSIEDLRMLDGVDWFKFELPQNASMYDSVSVSYNATKTNYLQLYLYDANGALIRSCDSISSHEKISLGGLDAGSYFIKVVGNIDKPVRNYTLSIQTCSDDPYELNNTRQQVDAAPERTNVNHEIVNPNSPNLGVIFEDRYTISNLIMKQQRDSSNAGEIDGFRFEMTGTGGENSYILLEYLETYLRENDCDLDLYVYKLADDEFYDSHSDAYWGEVVGSSTESRVPRNLVSDTDDRTLVKVNGREYVSLEGWAPGVYYVKVVGFVDAENIWDYKLTINLRNNGDDPGIGVTEKPDLHFATPANENWASVFVTSSVTVEDYYKQNLETTPFASTTKFYDNDNVYLNFVVKATTNANIDEMVNVAIYINGVRYDRYLENGVEQLIMARYFQAGDSYKISNLPVSSLIDAEGNHVVLKTAPDDILNEDVPNYINTIEVVIDPDTTIEEYDKTNNSVTNSILVFENNDDPYIPNGSPTELDNNTNENYCPILGPTVSTKIEDLKIVRKVDIVNGDVTVGSTEDWFSFELLKTGEEDSKVEIAFELRDLHGNLTDNPNLLDGDLDLYLYRHNDRYPDGLELVSSSLTKNNIETVSLANLPAGLYYIRVIGFNGQTNSYDMTIIGAQISAPTPPTELTVVSKVNDILGINWELNPDEYIISCDIEWVQAESDGTYDWSKAASKTVGRNVTSTKLTGLESGANYAFRVRGNNAIGTSDWAEYTNVIMDNYLNPSTYYGLIIAIDDYYGTANDISYTVSDARGVYNALLTDSHWAESNITLLTNSRATKAAITNALRTYAAQADENDVFFFYFAGSGYNSTIAGDSTAYLCSYINSETWSENFDNMISNSELVTLLNNIASDEKQIVLEVDGIVNYQYDYLTQTEVAYTVPFVYSPMVKNLIEMKDQVSVLTAADDYQDITGDSLSKLSYFGTYMVEAMTTFKEDEATVDINQDGRLSMEELYAYVSPRVYNDSIAATEEETEEEIEEAVTGTVMIDTPTFDANRTVSYSLDSKTNIVLENELTIPSGTSVITIPAGTKVIYQRDDQFKYGVTTVTIPVGTSFLSNTTTRLTYQGNGIVIQYQPESIIMAGDWKENPSLVVTTLIDVSDAYDGQISLREAIDYAQEGETVTFDENLANQTLYLLKTLTIDKGIMINGEANQIIISGSHKYQLFDITNSSETPVTLVGLTLIDGYTSANGGAILNRGNLYLANMLFYDNGTSVSGNYNAVKGGAIYNASNASLTITNSTFSFNEANNGGAIYNAGDLKLYNSILYGNEAQTNPEFGNSGTFVVDHSLLGIDPEFKDAANRDFRLTENSTAAIDKGYNLYARTPYFTLVTDIRGIDRFLYNSVDIGAYEYYDITGKMEMSTVVTTIHDVVDSTDGKTSLREAIANAGGTNITYITLAEGTQLTTNNGVSLVVKNGVYNTFKSGDFLVSVNGSAVAITEGSVLTLSDGITKVTYSNGIFKDTEGNTIVIPDGAAVTVAGVSYSYSNKKYTEYSLKIGTKITLADGSTAMVEDGINVLKNETLSTKVTFDANALRNEMTAAGLTGNITIETTEGEFLVLREVTIDASNIVDLTIDGNNANRIFNIEVLSSKVTLNNLLLTNASGENGGAIYIQSGTVALNSVTITNSKADSQGGAIYISSNGTVSLSKSYLRNNEAELGGAIYNEGTLTVNNESSLTNNAATDGGALYNLASATITGQTILESNSASNGAALYNASNSQLKVDSVYINNNVAAQAGGGLYNAGEAIVVNSIFIVNSAHQGGAVYTNSKLTIINATVVGNLANSSNGGGIYVADYAKAYGENETVVEITNTIVAFNEAIPANQSLSEETINSNFYSTSKTSNLPEINTSLFSKSISTSSAIIDTFSIFNQDPLFTNYSDSILWTNWDLSLQSSSPAIRTGSLAYYVDFDGTNVSVNKDIRGRSRAVSSNSLDMGAYERSIEAPSLIVTTEKDVLDPNDGETSLREALMYAAQSDLEGYSAYDDRVITFIPELSGKTIYWQTTYEINYDNSWFVKVSTEGLDNGITISGQELQIGEDRETGLPTYTGIFKMLGGDVEFNGLRFVDSTGADFYGGAITITGGTLHLTGVEMTGNEASMGGAIRQSGGILYLTNSLIHNNTAFQSGGGIQTTGGHFYMRNTTVAANYAVGGYYGGIDSYRTYVVIQNSIIANNVCTDKVEANFTDVQLENSLIGIMYQGNTYNGKNGCFVGTPISPVSPGFVGGEEAKYLISVEDFQLSESSKAVNAGNNNYANDSHGVVLAHDFIGNDRIISIVDMGALESVYADVPSTVVTTLEDVVDKNDGVISLREAIENAKTLQTPITFSDELVGNVVSMQLGTYLIDSNIKIDASNFLGGITINANNMSNIFRVSNGISLEIVALQLTGGNSNYGGAIFVENGTVSLTNVLLYGNTASENGGAIYLTNGSSLTLLNSTIAGNSSANGTGGIYSDSTTNKHAKMTFGNSIIANNYNGNGFDVDYYCYLSAPYTDVISVASLIGAMDSVRAIDSDKGNIIGTADSPIDADFVNDPVFVNGALSNIPNFNLNETSVAVNAGANYLVGQPGTRTELTTAAALFNTSETTRVISNDLDRNERIVAGTVDMGAYEFQNVSVIETPSVVVTTLDDLGVNILDGVISLREAIYYAGTVYIDDNGQTIKLGTTITFDSSLEGMTLTINSELGAILIEKGITIDASALTGGIVIDANQTGRVFEVAAANQNIVLINLTITGGSAIYGAGIYHKSGNLTIINSLLYENTAVNGYGAAIRSDGGTLKLVNCTVTKNDAGYYYGGIWSRGGNVTLQNTIVAQNTVGNVASIDNFILNLSMTASFVSRMNETQYSQFNGPNGNLVGTAQHPVDPYFVNWDINNFSLNRVDGDTGTISPAINTGNNGLAVYPNGKTLTTDLNGSYRFIGGKVDMGAFESILGETEIPSLVVTTAEDVVNDTDGLISLREAIAYANNYGLSNIITFSTNLTNQTIYLNESLMINKDITIDGSYLGTGITITTANNVYDRLFYIDTGNVNMRGMTLTNRIVDRQKAGESASDLTIDQGGVVYIRAGNLTMYNILIYDCMAKQGAVAYVADGQKVSLELVNVTVVNNKATAADGAVIYNNEGNLSIKNSIIAKNDAAQDVYKKSIVITTGNENITTNTQVHHSFIEKSDSLALFHTSNIPGGLTSFAANNFIGYTTSFVSYQMDGLTFTLNVKPVDLSGEADLLFIDVDNNDFTLSNDSLAVNTGNNSFVTKASELFRPNLDEIDLATNRRTVGRYVDLGAFENQTAFDYYTSDAYNMVTTANDIVDPTDGYVSLREAVTYVQRIYDLGITTVSVTFDRQLGTSAVMKLDTQSILINRPITIDATAVSNFMINGQQMNNIFRVSLDSQYSMEKVVIKNLTLYNGYELSGGGAIHHESGNLQLLNLLIHTSEGTYGGGILSESGELTLINCTVANNKAMIYDGNGGYGGGLYANQSTVNLYNTLLSNNYAEKLNSDAYFVTNDYVMKNSFVSNAGTEAFMNAFLASGTSNQVGWGDDNSLDPQFISVSEGNFQTFLKSDVVSAGDVNNLYDTVYVEKRTLTEGTVLFDGTTNMPLLIQNDQYYPFDAVLTDTNSYGVFPISKLQINEVVVLSDGTTDGSKIKYLGDVRFSVIESSTLEVNSIITLQNDDTITTIGDKIVYEYSMQLYDAQDYAKGDKLLLLDNTAVSVLSGLIVTVDGTEVKAQTIICDLNGTSRISQGSVDIGAYQRGGTLETPSLIVTTTEDVVDPTDGLISLREAIQYAYFNGWDNINDYGIGYNGEDGYGVAAGIPVSGSYHAENAMSQSSIYANTYLHPITFDASLAGSTINLNSPLQIYTPRMGATYTFDYMIDATALADNGGIIINAGGRNAFVIGRVDGMDNGEERDYNAFLGWYETTLLDIRGVTVTNANTAFQVNYFGLLYMRNCLVYNNNTAVYIADNDSNYGGVAHIYSSTLQKNIRGVTVGGAAYLYNTIVDIIYVQVKTTNPGYRQCNAFNTYMTDGIGGLRYSLTNCISGVVDLDYVFINYRENDFRLNRFSVAVNTGTEQYLATYLPNHADPETDVYGDDRVCGPTVDIGCFESAYVKEIPSTIVTTELDVVADDGLISLREAIYYAEQQPSGQLVSNTISFDASMANKTITLTNGALEIKQNYLRIYGGSANIAIDGNGKNRIFNINMNSSTANVSNVFMYNMTLKNGFSKNNGGAIYIGKGNVYLEGINMTQNEASGWGGAVFAENCELTLFKVKIGGNKAAYYGGVVNQYGTTLIGQSVIAENTGTIGKEDIYGKSVRNYYTTYGTYGYNVIGIGGNISIVDGQDNCRVGTLAAPIQPFIDAANGDLTLKPEYLAVVTPPAASSSYQNEVDQIFDEFQDEELFVEDDLLSGLFGELLR